MKYTVLVLLMAAAAASAQTHPKAASSAAKPAVTTARTAAAASKLPAGIPPAAGIPKVAFSLRYLDIEVGTGAEAEPNKMYKVQYTGWFGANGRADDGQKFDSSYDHHEPVLDKDGKPEMGEDGKPKQGPQMPFTFPQGFGRLIPGWDQGFSKMKIGGKRRLFIPWELAYGAAGRPGPDTAHPGIPPRSNLIFDVELLDVADLPTQANHPGAGGAAGMPAGHPMPPKAAQVVIGHPDTATTPAGAPAPAAAPAPATPATPAEPK